jgi:hypothetical protein
VESDRPSVSSFQRAWRGSRALAGEDVGAFAAAAKCAAATAQLAFY